MRIVFTDIDGVLLGGKAWLLPQNARARKLMLAGKRRAAMAQVSFDPCAVALLGRLLERTGARLVVHSGWRRTIGPTACRDVLVKHGIRPEHLHEDPACPMRPTSSKTEDIHAWLWKHGASVPRPGVAKHIPPRGGSARDQGVTPTPPSRTDNIELDFLVIDDDALPTMPQIRVDGIEGSAPPTTAWRPDSSESRIASSASTPSIRRILPASCDASDPGLPSAHWTTSRWSSVRRKPE